MERLTEARDETGKAPAVREGMYLLYSFDRAAFDLAVQGLGEDDHFLHDPTQFPVDVQASLDGLMKPGSAPLDRTEVWMHHDALASSPSAQFLAGLPVLPQAKSLAGWNTGVSLQRDTQGGWTSLWDARTKNAA